MKHLLNALYVLTPEAYLTLDGENAVGKKEGDEIGRFPMHSLSQITCFSYMGASPALMGKCAEMQIELTFFSPRGRFLARASGMETGNVLLRRRQYRIAADAAQSLAIAQNFIIGKLYKARWVLERGARDHALTVDAERLKTVSAQIRRAIDAVLSCTDADALRGIEGAELLDCDPRLLDDAAAWECVYVTRTWNHANALAGSHCDAPEQGLTAQGRAFVRALYAHRMLPDVSHLSEAAAWDVVRLGLGPVIASHANSRAACAHTRNLSDDLFCAIRDSGGVVGLNLYTDFLGGDGMATVVRPVEPLLALGGDETLALGGDLDGCDTLGGGITGVQDYPRLYAALTARGYDSALLQALFSDNWLRVLPK